MSDDDLAATLATEAGRLLLDVRREFADASVDDRKAAGDQRSHDFLMAALAAERPDDAVLSEEGADDPIRLSSRRVWIVDPLDGTREFSEPGRDDWAVHVALWSHGRLSAGAVSLPALGLVFGTEPAAAVPAVERARPLLITSRNRNPYSAVVVARALDCDAVRLGSAGAKAMAVVMGEADVYVHDGGMYQWDSAAPVAVALAAGLHASRLDGSPLVYNERDPWLPDFVICRPELADPVLDALRAHRTQRTSWR